jgi:hypothetical protein
MKNVITREYIIQLLRTNDKAIGRALMALNKRQTQDEQISAQTRHHNQRGFMPMHAKKGTGMAQFFDKTGYLTPKQLAYWRAVTPSGKTRIEKYVGQLLIVSNEKSKKVA